MSLVVVLLLRLPLAGFAVDAVEVITMATAVLLGTMACPCIRNMRPLQAGGSSPQVLGATLRSSSASLHA